MPDVDADAVVIVVGSEECGLVSEADRRLEAELPGVEGDGRTYVRDLQMDVAHRRGGWQRIECRVLAGPHQVIDVERGRCQLHPALRVTPGLGRSVGVQLDPVPVRIGHVDGLGDGVVRQSVSAIRLRAARSSHEARSARVGSSSAR